MKSSAKKVTSHPIARLASKQLRTAKSKNVRRVAGSDLSQAVRQKKRGHAGKK